MRWRRCGGRWRGEGVTLRSLTAVGCCLLSSCGDAPPKFTETDVHAVLAMTVRQAAAKFDHTSCFVTVIEPSKFERPLRGKAWGEWHTVLPGIRERSVAAQFPGQLPTDLWRGLLTTDQRYGCAETIRLNRPEFLEVEMQGRRYPFAHVSVWSECGPICGSEYGRDLVREQGRWRLYEDQGLLATGLST